MQPLKILNNVQKARLLHSLLSNEIPQFLGYLQELTETVLSDQERIAAEWKDPMFGVGMWIELARDTQKVMVKYPKDLRKSAPAFADQLFGGFMALFTVHALLQYTERGKHADPKFKPAVELLFG
ncbi:hypothetical protein [Mucilaginibacter myungsuensis]|uniref:Uncharacterized protein n=1 Tax=Mucilaginibacter myungsuensis TaxID=649104 RepID=A0A929PWQ4_9SPHI|nr:hypothetical protein [Mucilaginibacter myungsuensis]MBE9663078.1 hypothetical protein [Mucilaginibacter myungsuensis]MDN3598713.1 hypothetical protein [Mucilaginibacter myungsuensis]